jgi:hypothetical protein
VTDSQASALAAAGEEVPKPSARDQLVTTVAGLVPADILIAHAALLAATTKVDDKATPPVTTITEKGTLEDGFYWLIGLSILLYVAGRIKAGGAFKMIKDPLLALVPAAAFVGWTALQRSTAFDAVSGTTEGKRVLIGLICGIGAVAISLALAPKTAGDGG